MPGIVVYVVVAVDFGQWADVLLGWNNVKKQYGISAFSEIVRFQSLGWEVADDVSLIFADGCKAVIVYLIYNIGWLYGDLLIVLVILMVSFLHGCEYELCNIMLGSKRERYCSFWLGTDDGAFCTGKLHLIALCRISGWSYSEHGLM